MDEMKLPEGWAKAYVGDYLYLKNGFAFKSTDYAKQSDSTFPVIRISDLDGIYASDKDAVHVQEAAEGFEINNGDLLIAMSGATTGKVGVYTGNTPAYQNQRVGNLILHSNKYGNKGYRNYLISSLSENILKTAYGGAQPNISGKAIEQMSILLPPLAEQKIIADKLDTLLAQVESTKARLERIPQILKRFHQSVLAAAVSGKLTEEWRGHSLYNEIGYPQSWVQKGLSEVGELARGKSKHRPRNDPRLFGNEYPFIQTGEVANSNGLITSATKFYSDFGLAQSKLFSKGTLCITIAANIADTSILGIDACFPDSVVGFTPDDSMCEVRFVKYLIDVNKTNLEAFAPATAQKNINLKVLNELRLPFPTLEEQTEIVRRVEQLFAYADTIEQQVQNALTRVNNLTQSILAKAFRGELTEQWRKDNPDLISGDNSSEALLEKIKAEREAIKPEKKTQARKMTA
ncbi:MAG: restriction endonuclease subunit S [Methylobacter sp.]|uniref:restriction endonuclease subunit S n=1 Tax=Methylobacter sp. TaxID=2051955 RepID=UPI00258C2596|nr:restriction endonuclease subunit S [Methylobacter sp.]MCL7421757.1 restriction endonuclease subunit S [Methylobacter sp.]